MEVIPAIDLRGGKCVRLYQGDYGRETVFDDDPIAVLHRWEAAGARRVHIVDLEGARDGVRVNGPTVRRLVAAASVPLQVSGGIRDAAGAAELLDAGVDRVIFGTAAIEAPEEVEKAIAERGAEHVIVAVDARDGMVATRGWLQTTETRAIDLVRSMARRGVQRVIYTDINRDATLEHPDFAAAAELLRETGCRILVAGGIASVEDLVRLSRLGVEGAITGQAIYTGAIDLRAAISKISALER